MRFSPGRCRAFSFLEVLFVLALIAVLLSISLAGYSALIQANSITAGAAMISDELTEARSDAVAQNMTVEVRLYAVAQPASSTLAYTVLQLHWLKADGTTPPVKLPLILPTGIAIDATPIRSSLIGANPEPVPADATDSHLNSQTRVFHYLPDGSTDLNSTTSWFLTIRAATASDPAHFPSDWACIQVDAATGRTRILRP
ncbi:MAG: Verru_Chthon cassette protein D [Methylacidiphilales bacterium]|nr:Verru_Chthon cassette protein D [Candidatus Methylacidiphilales bacterium]